MQISRKESSNPYETSYDVSMSQAEADQLEILSVVSGRSVQDLLTDVIKEAEKKDNSMEDIAFYSFMEQEMRRYRR